MINLFDICNPKQWKTISSSKLLKEGYPVYGANGIIGYYNEYNHKEPTLLITCRGATCGTINISQPYSYINGNAMALDDLDEEKANLNYLAYFLKHRGLDDVITGSAQPQITRDGLRTVKIPLPNLPAQTKIAQVLDKADQIRQKRKKAVELADEFLKSLFLEMFGDPVVNEKRWKIEILDNLTSKIGSGSTPKGGDSIYIDEGISLIRSLNIHDNLFLLKNLAHIDDEQAEKLRNVAVKKNDVLINITGASVARCCIVPDEVLPARVNQHVSILRLNEKLLPEFLMMLLICEPMKRKLLNNSGSGATREALTKQQLQELEIIVPPIDVQQKFVDIYLKISTLKNRMESSKTDELFNSLSQQYFTK